MESLPERTTTPIFLRSSVSTLTPATALTMPSTPPSLLQHPQLRPAPRLQRPNHLQLLTTSRRRRTSLSSSSSNNSKSPVDLATLALPRRTVPLRLLSSNSNSQDNSSSNRLRKRQLKSISSALTTPCPLSRRPKWPPFLLSQLDNRNSSPLALSPLVVHPASRNSLSVPSPSTSSSSSHLVPHQTIINRSPLPLAKLPTLTAVRHSKVSAPLVRPLFSRDGAHNPPPTEHSPRTRPQIHLHRRFRQQHRPTRSLPQIRSRLRHHRSH